jgi:NRAMP (natural resistance-associated macrophage protein)-like metal ion transporter
MMNHAHGVPESSSMLRRLGPGLITGAADDDPSGIATYSQVGAQFGFRMAWTMLFSLPFMIVIQEISGRIGCATGRGLADNMRRHYAAWIVRSIVLLLLVANIINLGADIGAMGAALQLLLGGNPKFYTVLFGILCIVLEVFLRYKTYANILKWLTLSLFSYVAVVFAVHLQWKAALLATFVPHLTFDSASMMALVAVLGTTISPYLFFWQAALEVEEGAKHRGKIGRLNAVQAAGQFLRIRMDTIVGMGTSNVIAVFIIFATAATLHASGITTIQTSAQAALALKPIAGKFAFALFAAGIIGTGLLAVPVLAGSGAYALAETFQWKEGLDRKLFQAKSFYAAIAVATLIGVALNFTSLNPVKALYWSAVINGVLAAPVMAVVMLMAQNKEVMGEFTLPGWMVVMGWAATLIMFFASVGFFVLGLV